MPSFLMPLLEGVAAGAVVAFVFFFVYSRTQRKSAARTLTAARSEAEQLVADASRKGAEARAAIVLEGKMETLRLREARLAREQSDRVSATSALIAKRAWAR